MIKEYEVIILGGGAAGLMCAIEAAKRGRRTLVIDHAASLGNKIRASGGGRCNFTNLDASPSSYVSENPHFCRSALERFTPADFLDLVKKHRIQFHAKKPGQLFCDGPAQQIVEMLLKEAGDAGAEIREGVSISKVGKDGFFKLETSGGPLEAEKLVVATGGLSFPRMGATGFGYDLARMFGHRIVSTCPALDGFVFDAREAERFDGLAGLSVDARISCGGKDFADPILFTHKGLSGPGVLQASLYWKSGDEVVVNFAPDVPGGVLDYLVKTKARGSLQSPAKILARILPQRLAERFAGAYFPEIVNLAQARKKDLEELAISITSYGFIPAGTAGYEKAEVTRGGVDTGELSSKTMESRKTPGLFFVGEVVDVTGELGGYNFQWAWSSGWAAGQAV